MSIWNGQDTSGCHFGVLGGGSTVYVDYIKRMKSVVEVSYMKRMEASLH